MDMSVDEPLSPGLRNETPTRLKENGRRTLLYAAQRGMYERRLRSPKGFSLLPTYLPSTPGKEVYNPFQTDVDLLEGHTCSPTIFSKTESPQNGDFTWSIDDISRIHPAPIDSPIDLPEEKLGSELEVRAQAAIGRYFSMRHNIVSPIGSPGQWVSPTTAASGTPASSSTPRQQARSLKLQDASTQTFLSFPSVLPPEVEALLKQYQIIVEDAECNDESNNSSSSSNSSLRRKLFFNKEEECLSPVKRTCFDSLGSPCLNGSMKISRLDWTLEDRTDPLSSPDISPIKFKPELMSYTGPVHDGIFTSTINSGSMDTGYNTLDS